VPAGHDQFPVDLARRVLSGYKALESEEYIYHDGALNLTYLALNFSHYINGVAKKHQEVSSHMFAGYKIDEITNGVNASEWISEPFQVLFNRFIPGWQEDNFSLRSALGIPKQEIWGAHSEIKKELINHVNRETNAGFDLDYLTIGFARRSSTYKRADLIFQDINRLKAMASEVGPIQIVYSGKAHPQDQGGKELIRKIFQAAEVLKPEVKVAYLENYDMNLAKLITSGVDLWLNTPIPPREASGTSGMKAAMNGIPSLSILDGWWIEGCIEGMTGWAIGEKASDKDIEDSSSKDADSLYLKLETIIVPLFYRNRDQYTDIMSHTIALNGSFFNTQRMVQQYVLKAYFE
jgi:starch phosphorylase